MNTNDLKVGDTVKVTGKLYGKDKVSGTFTGKIIRIDQEEGFIILEQPGEGTDLYVPLDVLTNIEVVTEGVMKNRKIALTLIEGADFEDKDAMRISDIVRKSGGDDSKAAALAQRMANSITDVSKALRRARAAEDQNYNDLAAIFYNRYKQLGGV